MQHGTPESVILSPNDRERLQAMIRARGGVQPVARALGVSRPSVAAAAGGLPVRAGTVLMIRVGLAACAAADENAAE